jgi:hypothetical protein
METPLATVASPARFSWIVGGDRRVEIISMGGVSIVQIAAKAYAVVRDDTREFLACCPSLGLASRSLSRIVKGGR